MGDGAVDAQIEFLPLGVHHTLVCSTVNRIENNNNSAFGKLLNLAL